MLEYWYKEKRTLVDFRRGPLGPHFDGFANYLKAKGYSRDSGRSVLGRSCQFNSFLIERGISNAKEISESLVASFAQAYYAPARAAGPKYSPQAETRLSLKHLLTYLVENKIVRPPQPKRVVKLYSWLLSYGQNAHAASR